MDYLDQVDINSPDIEVITEATVGQEQVEIFVFVKKTNPTVYCVCVQGIVRHPHLDANGAIRALGQYLMSFGNKNNRPLSSS